MTKDEGIRNDKIPLSFFAKGKGAWWTKFLIAEEMWDKID
jgi:hypothetical protein